jgi:hypothetical protein
MSVFYIAILSQGRIIVLCVIGLYPLEYRVWINLIALLVVRLVLQLLEMD